MDGSDSILNNYGNGINNRLLLLYKYIIGFGPKFLTIKNVIFLLYLLFNFAGELDENVAARENYQIFGPNRISLVTTMSSHNTNPDIPALKTNMGHIN